MGCRALGTRRETVAEPRRYHQAVACGDLQDFVEVVDVVEEIAKQIAKAEVRRALKTGMKQVWCADIKDDHLHGAINATRVYESFPAGR